MSGDAVCTCEPCNCREWPCSECRLTGILDYDHDCGFEEHRTMAFRQWGAPPDVVWSDDDPDVSTPTRWTNSTAP